MKQADTAIDHYYDPKEYPRRKVQRQRILDFLEQSGRARTLKEIAYALEIPDSTVSARLNEMRTDGDVDTYGERACEINGIKKQTWFLAPTKCQRPITFPEAV